MKSPLSTSGDKLLGIAQRALDEVRSQRNDKDGLALAALYGHVLGRNEAHNFKRIIL